jgi:micrococcal nuclease
VTRRLGNGGQVALMGLAAIAAAILTGRLADGPSGSSAASEPARTTVSPSPATTGPSCTLPTRARVTKVTDGDTIHVDLCGDVTVRVIGINTPEIHKPGSPVQCFGPEAAEAARESLLGETVLLVGDRGAGVRDRYGRRLAYVQVDGLDYGGVMVRMGLAEANDYGHRQSRSDRYAADQRLARQDKLGAWAACPAPFVK